jgi:CRP/FNR family transcriptional regulator, cyclic AMP receptor protein
LRDGHGYEWVTPDVRAPDRFVAVSIFRVGLSGRHFPEACHKIVIVGDHEIATIKLRGASRGATWLTHASILASWPAPVRRFKAGEVIFRQGDAAEELFVIQSGTVEIRLGNRVLDTLPQLSIFGEMALIDSSPRSATAIAATDVTLVPVGEKQFLFLVGRTPHFALNVMRVLAQRLRTTSSAI